jgi:hypothetical protein
MSDPLLFRGKKLLRFLKNRMQKLVSFVGKNKLIFIMLGLTGVVLTGKLLILKTTPAVYAAMREDVIISQLNSPLLEKKNLFGAKDAKKLTFDKKVVFGENAKAQTTEMESKLFNIVGDTPLAEMVPFIARRESKVAAFLVGIAKKESSFGLASPSKEGSTCYNYWGYKGTGSRGTSLGYSCFGSAEEAIRIVGDRIEVLVAKERNTPAKMVDTWKCGRSCAGDPGAPSWVSTVALYFNRIVRIEG